MKRLLIICCMTAILLAGVALKASAQTPAEILKKTFPNLAFDSINPSPIAGVYEVVTGTRIAYFAPETGHLIFGEIIDKNGKSITATRIESMVLAKAKALPLDKAVKFGEGTSTVIEFTDPDCPYCRRASTFFQSKQGIRRYVFFLPLAMHPDAENKVRHILCSTDKPKAYEEAMNGKLDKTKYDVCKTPEVEEMVKLHKDMAQMMGITGTPFFLVNGKVVSGFDPNRIEEALKLK